MDGHHIVAIYPNHAAAENARRLLLDAGIEARSLRLSTEDGTVEESTAPRHSWFLSWLFGTGIPEDDRNWYEVNLTGGRAALSVLVPANGHPGRIEEILASSGAVEVDEEDDEEEELAPTSRSSLVSQPSGPDQVDRFVQPAEELGSGRKTTRTRRLIRTHMMERPMEVHERDGRGIP